MTLKDAREIAKAECWKGRTGDALWELDDRITELEKQLAKCQENKDWISVKDRLPEKYKEVLIYEKWCDTPCIAHLNNKGDWHPDLSFVEVVGDAYTKGNITQKDVIYWMPLPDPPKGE